MPEKKKAVVPRLRFPEFRNAGPWEVKQLGEVVSIANGLSVVQNNEPPGIKVTRIETISDGFVNITKVGYIKSLDDIESYKLQVGDILFSHINSLDHIGKCAFVDQPFDLYHGMNLLRFQVHKRDSVPKFIYYVVCSEPFRSSIRSRANQAVNQASINQTEVGRSRIALPPFLEQQKIADCLSSLDELIELEAKKLEALQAHKKGLMQQLFPREGETTPRLRFPEFRDAGPWEVKRLGEICAIKNGSSNAQDHTENGSYPLFDRSEVIKKSNRYLYDCEAVIIPGEGATFTPRYYRGKFDLHQRAYALMGFRANARFVGYQIEAFKNLLVSQAVSSTVLSLRMPILERFTILLPTGVEQQKIADCLSSLDELIELEAKKLKALQAHKKGLMQQLFPQEVG